MAYILYEFLINKTPSNAHKFYGNIVDIDAPNKGILKLEIEPGQIIKKGDIIGMIEDVEVIAPDSGIVLRSGTINDPQGRKNMFDSIGVYKQ
jgi:predicted deacylase